MKTKLKAFLTNQTEIFQTMLTQKFNKTQVERKMIKSVWMSLIDKDLIYTEQKTVPGSETMPDKAVQLKFQWF